MRRIENAMGRVVAGLVGALLLGACAHPVRPVAPVAADTVTYSAAISKARQEQLLMNIVRLRYNDPVSFVDVQQLTTQETALVRGDLASAVALGGQSFDEVLHGAGAAELTSQPTVVYSALRGGEYARQLLQPLPPATIFLMSQSGWSVERLMLCCLARIGDLDNARAAAGPTPHATPDNADFRRVARLMRAMQEQGNLLVQVIDAEDSDSSAARVVLKWRRSTEHGEQLAELFRRHWVTHVEAIEGDRYVAEISTRGNRLGDYSARGRSLLGVLSALSQSVHVPAEHAGISRHSQDRPAAARACGAPGGWHEVNGGFFAVESSKEEPVSAAVAVTYRGYWFYVDDRCHDAKATLNLVDHLYALQAGMSGGPTTLFLLGG